MNIEFILNRVISHLDNQKRILEKTLKNLFDFLDDDEYQQVKKILNNEGICLIGEDAKIMITELDDQEVTSIINNNTISENMILESILSYLNYKNELSENVFNIIFKDFSVTQKHQITDILLENNIFITHCDADKNLCNEKKMQREVTFRKECYVNVSQYEHPIEIISGDLQDLKFVNNEQLCFLFQNGNDLALHLLIQNNKRLVYKRVKKYERIYKHKLDLDDLYSYGNEGLIEAAKKYEFDKGAKFTTFAIWWIDQKILRSIMQYGFTVRFPVHRFDDLNKLIKIEKKYNIDNENDLIKKAEEELGFSCEKIKELLKIKECCLSISSLNTYLGEDYGTELIELIENCTVADTETLVTKKLFIEELNKLLETLTDRERKIIELRFGLYGKKTHTLEEIGEKFGVTRERIRQIEAKALRKLKHPSRANILIDFMDLY